MLTLTSQDLRGMATARAVHTVAHLTGVAAISAGGAAIIDRTAKTRAGKLAVATGAIVVGAGASALAHIASDRVVETVADGVFGAGLLAIAFHGLPGLFRRDMGGNGGGAAPASGK